MTTIMKSNSSNKRVVDKAENDAGHWPVAKFSVQEDLNGPDVKGNEEPIEQATSYDTEAQALVNSTSQDEITAVIKSTNIQGRSDSTVVKVQDHDSLQAQPVEHTEAEILDFMDRYSSRVKESCQVPPFESREASFAWVIAQVKSRPKALEYFQQHKSHEEHEAATTRVLERHKARVKAKAKGQSLESHKTTTACAMESDKVKASVARKDSGKSIDDHPLLMAKVACPSSVMGLAPLHTGGGSSKPLASQPNLMTKSPSSQAAKAAFEYKVDSSREPSNIPPDYFNPWSDRSCEPLKAYDGPGYVTVFGTIEGKKETTFDKIKKHLTLIVVGLVIGVAMLTGTVHQGGGGSSQIESHDPSFGFANSTYATLPTVVGWNDGITAQGRVRVASDKFVNSTQVSDVASFDVPISSPSSQALVILHVPTQIALPSKIEDWMTLSSTMPWKDRSELEEHAGKAVAIIHDSSSSSSGAPAAIWKLSFEYFELEETGDVHVGIVCDTAFTGAHTTSNLLYGGPAPLYFKSRTVALDEVTLDHGMDWYTGLPLITVGFGRNRRNRVTIVCGDMPSENPNLLMVAPVPTETDATSDESTGLALFQGPSYAVSESSLKFAPGIFPSVKEAIAIHWIQHYVGSSGKSKALIVWQQGMTKQGSVSESKHSRDESIKVDIPTYSAFVLAFDVYMLDGKTSLDIHLECVYNGTGPFDSVENGSDNQHVLFLSNTFPKHQVVIKIEYLGKLKLVTIGFWDDEFSITAICEDVDAFGSSSSLVSHSLLRQIDPTTAEEAEAAPMLAPQPHPEQPSEDLFQTVWYGLNLLLFLTLSGTAWAVKELSKRRINQVPRLQAAPSAQAPCRRAAPSEAGSIKKAKPPGILKPRIRKANQRRFRFDKEVTVREYHRTVGVRPRTVHSDYALALDWSFAEGKAKMESFGHGRTANGEAFRVPTPHERRKIFMKAGFDDAKLEQLEAGARALRRGT